MEMHLKYKSKTLDVDLPDEATFETLLDILGDTFSIDTSRAQLLTGGKLVRPREVLDELVTSIVEPEAKVTLLAPAASKIDAIHSAEEKSRHEQSRRSIAHSTLAQRSRQPRSTQAKSEYTFGEIEVLPYGNEQGALSYLDRIRQDKSVAALMAKYKLKVGVLAELDPLLNTGENEKKLGRNDNMGSRILLRIRTDDYLGFRSYGGVLKVLCHELAHNTYSSHDADFWRLCRMYEAELDELDPWKGGHSLID